MTIQFQDFASSVLAAEVPKDVWSHSITLFETVGFRGAYYASRSPGKDPSQDQVKTSDGLAGWREAYFELGDHARDPLLTYAPVIPRTFNTGAEFLNDYPSLSEEDVSVVRRANDFGYRSGLALKMPNGRQNEARGWNLMSDLSRADMEEVYTRYSQVLYLCAALAEVRLQKMLDSFDIRLTRRETESLCWLASGLRTDQIADRMGIRPVTVDLHMRNAKQKLGARTREQALAIALSNGLLDL